MEGSGREQRYYIYICIGKGWSSCAESGEGEGVGVGLALPAQLSSLLEECPRATLFETSLMIPSLATRVVF